MIFASEIIEFSSNHVRGRKPPAPVVRTILSGAWLSSVSNLPRHRHAGPRFLPACVHSVLTRKLNAQALLDVLLACADDLADATKAVFDQATPANLD